MYEPSQRNSKGSKFEDLKDLIIARENEATKVTEAIEYYDFEKALELESEFIVSNGVPSDKSHMYILLLELNQLINSVNRIRAHEETKKLTFSTEV